MIRMRYVTPAFTETSDKSDFFTLLTEHEGVYSVNAAFGQTSGQC